MTPKAQAVEEPTDKVDFVRMKSFSSSKDTVKRTRRQGTENICRAHI